jgi:hypothetical protein
MDEPILKADSRYRRMVFLLFLVLIAVGGGIIWWFQGVVNEIVATAESDPIAAVRRTHWLFMLLMGLLGLSLLAFSVYLVQLGVRVRRSGQLPPPGTRVLRDVSVRTGPSAMRRARLLLALAVVLGLAGGIVPLWMERQFRRSFDIPAIYQQAESPPPIPGIPPRP